MVTDPVGPWTVRPRRGLHPWSARLPAASLSQKPPPKPHDAARRSWSGRAAMAALPLQDLDSPLPLGRLSPVRAMQFPISMRWLKWLNLIWLSVRTCQRSRQMRHFLKKKDYRAEHS